MAEEVLALALPGIAHRQIYAPTIEARKAKVEKLVIAWFAGVNRE